MVLTQVAVLDILLVVIMAVAAVGALDTKAVAVGLHHEDQLGADHLRRTTSADIRRMARRLACRMVGLHHTAIMARHHHLLTTCRILLLLLMRMGAVGMVARRRLMDMQHRLEDTHGSDTCCYHLQMLAMQAGDIPTAVRAQRARIVTGSAMATVTETEIAIGSVNVSVSESVTRTETEIGHVEAEVGVTAGGGLGLARAAAAAAAPSTSRTAVSATQGTRTRIVTVVSTIVIRAVMTGAKGVTAAKTRNEMSGAVAAAVAVADAVGAGVELVGVRVAVADALLLHQMGIGGSSLSNQDSRESACSKSGCIMQYAIVSCCYAVELSITPLHL